MNHSLTETTLENGIKLLLINIPDSRNFDMTVAINSGYRHATKDADTSSPETPHILEHCVFDGSTNYDSVDALQEIFDASGGEWNGITTTYHNLFPFHNKPKNAEKIIHAGLDMVFFPLLRSQSFEEELQVVTHELGDKMNDLALNADQYTQQSILPDFPVSTDLMLNSLHAATYEEVITYHRNYYTTDNTTIVIGCNLANLPAQLIERTILTATKHASRGVRRPHPKFTVSKTNDRSSNFVKLGRSIKTATLALQYAKAESFDTVEDSIVSSIKSALFVNMVSNMKSYSVQHKLRKQGLAYGTFITSARSIETHGFDFLIECPNERFNELLIGTLTMTCELARNGISDTQFETLKNDLIESYEDQLSSPGDVIGWYLEDYLIEGDSLSVDEYKSLASAISQEDVLAYARSVLRHENQFATVFSSKAIRHSFLIDMTTEDIFNGRTPETFKSVMKKEIDRYYEKDPDATGLRKFTIFVNTRPLLAWLLISAEAALGIGITYHFWFDSTMVHQWWHVIIILVGVLIVIEAVGDAVTRCIRHAHGHS